MLSLLYLPTLIDFQLIQVMDLLSIFLINVLLLLFSSCFYKFYLKKTDQNRLPPGPPGLPIFGNMFDLGAMPHRTLFSLKEKYGDVIWLRFGAINTMVILSAKSATELFKKYDLNFADRTITELMRVHDYDKASLALASYGSYWRVLRRLVTVDMLVNKRINESEFVRRKCVDDMLIWIEQESRKEGGIHVARFLFLTTFNLLGNLMLSRNLLDPESKEGAEFFQAMTGLMEWTGHAYLGDYFPRLKWIDLKGLKKKMERDLGKALQIASKFVKERVEKKKNMAEDNTDKRKDFLDVLLEFEGSGKDEPDKISERDINIFILEIFMAGSETTSSTIEWALTELLLNKETMIKVKAELAEVVGTRKVEESDIDNLPYLQATINETLRLHPPIPFLVPRKAMKDTDFMGYHIPKNTQVLVNTWAIGRDQNVWDDPFCFNPDRFIGSKVDYKGQHYKFLPFGAGRRMCAGVPLAHRVLHLILGSLLQQFDWKLDVNTNPTTLDMRDRLGVTTRKFEPLIAVPIKCSMIV